MRTQLKLLVTLIVVTAFASTAFASFTRVHTLGDGGRYFKDESGVRLFPSLIAEFPDQFGLDVAKATTAFAKPIDEIQATISGHLHLTTYMGIVLGVWASDYNDGMAAAFAEQFALPTNEFDPTGAQANRQWDLLLGRAFGWGDLGLHIIYGSATYDRSPAWTEDSQFDSDMNRASDAFKVHELGVRAGGTFKLPRITIDASLGYTTHGYQYKPDMVSFPGSLTAGSEIDFMARMNWSLTNRWALVPMLKVATGSMSGTQTRSPSNADHLDPEFQTNRKISMMDIEFGVAVILTPMAGMTVYIAPAIEYAMQEGTVTVDDTMDKTTIKTWNLPSIRSGVEYQILDWMVLRSSFVKFMASKETKVVHDDPDGKTVVTTDYSLVPKIGNQAGAAAYAYMLGVGLTFEHLFLDFELDPGYLTRGPYLMSGSGAPMFFQASGTYTF